MKNILLTIYYGMIFSYIIFAYAYGAQSAKHVIFGEQRWYYPNVMNIAELSMYSLQQEHQKCCDMLYNAHTASGPILQPENLTSSELEQAKQKQKDAFQEIPMWRHIIYILLPKRIKDLEQLSQGNSDFAQLQQLRGRLQNFQGSSCELSSLFRQIGEAREQLSSVSSGIPVHIDYSIAQTRSVSSISCAIYQAATLNMMNLLEKFKHKTTLVVHDGEVVCCNQYLTYASMKQHKNYAVLKRFLLTPIDPSNDMHHYDFYGLKFLIAANLKLLTNVTCITESVSAAYSDWLQRVKHIAHCMLVHMGSKIDGESVVL